MRVDRGAVAGTLGVALCVLAAAVLRSAHLYDEKFNENLGMFYTTGLVVVGGSLALFGFLASRVNEKWRAAGIAVAVLAFAAVAFVAGHPDDTCVLGCGPF